MAPVEIVTGLRKTPARSPAGCTRAAAQALPIRVNPRNPWFEPPFPGPGLQNRDPRETTQTTRGAGSRIPHSLAIPTQSGGLQGRDQLFS